MTSLSKGPDVVSTELEEGAVLLNLATRTYFSLNDGALAVWNLIEPGRTIEEIAAALSGSFAGVEDHRYMVETFVDRLEAEKLVVRSESPGEVSFDVAPPRGVPEGMLEPPELLKHDEPLHEVPLHPFDPQLPLAE
jgi:hypothetical protein